MEFEVWKGELQEAMDGVDEIVADHWEREMVRDLYNRVKETIGKLEGIDRDIEERGVNSPDPEFVEQFKRIFTGFKDMLTGGPKGDALTGRASSYLNQVWDCGIRAIAGFLENKASAVGVDNWSISVTGGFPLGVSASISVYFRQIKAEEAA